MEEREAPGWGLRLARITVSTVLMVSLGLTLFMKIRFGLAFALGATTTWVVLLGIPVYLAWRRTLLLLAYAGFLFVWQALACLAFLGAAIEPVEPGSPEYDGLIRWCMADCTADGEAEGCDGYCDCFVDRLWRGRTMVDINEEIESGIVPGFDAARRTCGEAAWGTEEPMPTKVPTEPAVPSPDDGPVP